MYALATIMTTLAHLFDFRPTMRGLPAPLESTSGFFNSYFGILAAISLVLLATCLLIFTLPSETLIYLQQHYELELHPEEDSLKINKSLEKCESEDLSDTLEEYLLEEDYLFEEELENSTPTMTSARTITNHNSYKDQNQTAAFLALQKKMRLIVKAMKELRLEESLDKLRDEVELRTRMVLLEELGQLGTEDLDKRIYSLCKENRVRHRKIVWREEFVGVGVDGGNGGRIVGDDE